MAATTTVKVHRRKTPSAARRDETIAETRERIAGRLAAARSRLAARAAARKETAGQRARLPILRGRGTKAASPDASRGAGTSPAIAAPDASRSAAPAPAAAAAPRIAGASGAPRAQRVLPATSAPFCTEEGGFRADPLIENRARRGAYPLEAPSWRAFRGYLTDRSDLQELRAVGLPAMMRAHRGLALALAAVTAGLLLTVAALVAYFCLAPATAAAESPYTAAEVAAPESTAQSQWKAGEIPVLYQADEAWSAIPYGQATLGEAGSAPTAFAMAYVAATGDTTKTPADFAQWATGHDLTASGADTVQALLSEAAAEFGVSLDLIAVDDHALRRAIVSNIPVLAVTEPGTFEPVASVIVLDDIDRDSRIVIRDPASPTRTGKSWSFDDITDATVAAYEVHAA